jgi:hypothetical protein
MRRNSSAVLALVCSWLSAARAQEAVPVPPGAGPDLDFLEYLGAWAEDDDEWLAIEEWQKDLDADAKEDAEESESEREDDDESK